MDRALPAALQMLGRARVTGILSVAGPPGMATFHLQDGRVLWAASDTTARIGDVLVEKGFITVETLENALRIQKRKRKTQPILTVLYEWNLISREVGEAEIDAQMVEVLRDVLTWDAGILRIERLSEKSDMITSGCDVETLLLRVSMLQAGVDDGIVASGSGGMAC